MKKALVIAGIGALMASTSLSGARADDPRWPKWYIGLSGGYTYMQDEDVSGQTTATKLDAGPGFGFAGALGYSPGSTDAFLNGFRMELEVGYHQNEIRKVEIAGGTSQSGPGNYSAMTYMGNLYYDFLNSSQWTPYIGGGAGLATVHLGTDPALGTTGTTSNVFAYQGLVGIGYSPVTIPNTMWTIGYRYLGTTDPKFSTPTGSAKTSYDSNSVEAGVHFNF